MSLWTGLDDDRTTVTMWREPEPKVLFDEDGMPVDRYLSGGSGYRIWVDLADLEEMILARKFRSKVEVSAYCKQVYAEVYDKDDPSTQWSPTFWTRIKAALFPEARAVYNSLPHQIYPGERNRKHGSDLMEKGECGKGHPIRSIDDIVAVGSGRVACKVCRQELSEILSGRPPTRKPLTTEDWLARGECAGGHKIESAADLCRDGRTASGGDRYGCLHCRRERSRRSKAKKRKSK